MSQRRHRDKTVKIATPQCGDTQYKPVAFLMYRLAAFKNFLEALMRLWSLHPQYLDAQGLVALWREALLAQAVLCGQTKGYQHHPQLTRFRQCEHPTSQIAHYLTAVCAEAHRRDYCFNRAKIGAIQQAALITVTHGQLAYEWRHLMSKLSSRAPDWLASLPPIAQPEPHPLFHLAPGEIAAWEIGATSQHGKNQHKTRRSYE
jgi:hypothetical protein